MFRKIKKIFHLFNSAGPLFCQSGGEKEGSEYKGTWPSLCNPRRIVTSSNLTIREENWLVDFLIIRNRLPI